MKEEFEFTCAELARRSIRMCPESAQPWLIHVPRHGIKATGSRVGRVWAWFRRSWGVEAGERKRRRGTGGKERAVVRGEEEEASTGVGWLEAGDRRPPPRPETKEEKEDSGSRAGKKKKREKASSGGVHACL